MKGTAQDNSGTVQKVEFYIDADSIPACIDATPKSSGSTFTCNWDTTTKADNSHTVKTKAYDPAGNSAFSASVSFAINNIINGITVLTPNGGETWPIGSTHAIQWSFSGISGNVKIELSRDGGATWTTLSNSTANSGTKNWKVTKPATTQARIRVSSVNSSSVADTGNTNFTIQ